MVFKKTGGYLGKRDGGGGGNSGEAAATLAGSATAARGSGGGVAERGDGVTLGLGRGAAAWAPGSRAGGL